MSWSASATSLPKQELEPTLERDFAENYPDPPSDVHLQYNAAMQAAFPLINKLNRANTYTITIAGQTKEEGNDAFIVISVTAHS